MYRRIYKTTAKSASTKAYDIELFEEYSDEIALDQPLIITSLAIDYGGDTRVQKLGIRKALCEMVIATSEGEDYSTLYDRGEKEIKIIISDDRGEYYQGFLIPDLMSSTLNQPSGSIKLSFNDPLSMLSVTSDLSFEDTYVSYINILTQLVNDHVAPSTPILIASDVSINEQSTKDSLINMMLNTNSYEGLEISSIVADLANLLTASVYYLQGKLHIISLNKQSTKGLLFHSFVDGVYVEDITINRGHINTFFVGKATIEQTPTLASQQIKVSQGKNGSKMLSSDEISYLDTSYTKNENTYNLIDKTELNKRWSFEDSIVASKNANGDNSLVIEGFNKTKEHSYKLDSLGGDLCQFGSVNLGFTNSNDEMITVSFYQKTFKETDYTSSDYPHFKLAGSIIPSNTEGSEFNYIYFDITCTINGIEHVFCYYTFNGQSDEGGWAYVPSSLFTSELDIKNGNSFQVNSNSDLRTYTKPNIKISNNKDYSGSPVKLWSSYDEVGDLSDIESMLMGKVLAVAPKIGTDTIPDDLKLTVNFDNDNTGDEWLDLKDLAVTYASDNVGDLELNATNKSTSTSISGTSVTLLHNTTPHKGYISGVTDEKGISDQLYNGYPLADKLCRDLLLHYKDKKKKITGVIDNPDFTCIDVIISDTLGDTNILSAEFDLIQDSVSLVIVQTQANTEVAPELSFSYTSEDSSSSSSSSVSSSGSSSVDLSNYYRKVETDTLLDSKVSISELEEYYYNKTEADSLLDEKVNTEDLEADYYDSDESDERFQPIEATQFSQGENCVEVRTPTRTESQYYEFWDPTIGWAGIKTGVITANSLAELLEGVLLKKGGEKYLETLNNYIALHKSIGSAAFSSGYGGEGTRWDILNSIFEVDDLHVRGGLHASEFEINKMRATNGSLWVSDAAKITAVTSVTIDGEEYWECSVDDEMLQPFRSNDWVRCQNFSGISVSVKFITESGNGLITESGLNLILE